MCVTPNYRISFQFCILYFKPAIKFVRKEMKEIVPTVDCNLVFSLLKLLDCFFQPFVPQEVCLLHSSIPSSFLFL